MQDYNFRAIETKWQKTWAESKTFKTGTDTGKPKYYVLDMFPYPSGAGLHVGHPLGYIASDIVARFKRHKGFNVLHPMGYDSFGLPAEQYAIQTGQHPAVTTENNVARYRQQLDKIGFSYDWDREVRTSSPDYYKWTQWIFKQLFNSWYNKDTQKAEDITGLAAKFALTGNEGINAACDEHTPALTAEAWEKFSESEKELYLLNYRLAYLADMTVNWCPGLGTVLANEEVKDGFSERGGYPVERKTMRQWCLRITAYAERLLNDLDTIDFPEAVKEMQRNWIGRSVGCSLKFKAENSDLELEVFTTRVDTTFGVTFLSIAPEHELVEVLTSAAQKAEVEAYVEKAKHRSERDRMSDVKTISGVFTGSYVINPFNGERVPVWIADYVLAGYGTGVVMAVPSSDTRDYAFATHFGLPIIQVQQGEGSDITAENFDPKKGTMINSGFLDGLTVPEAIAKAIEFTESKGLGKAKINYRLRDAIFSRQRYWGEPFPVYYENGIPRLMEDKDLPVELPPVDAYLPTESGEPPLGRAHQWKGPQGHPMELNTMPGWAGSSWYFLRYMDPQNPDKFCSQEAEEYWQDVDLYIGGSEHATGHLLYSRFWHKFLYDRGLVTQKEPYKKLVNQGMIQGRSNLVCKETGANVIICKSQLEAYAKENMLKPDRDFTWIHIDVNKVENDKIKVEDLRQMRPDFKDVKFEFSLDENGDQVIRCDAVVEKMSKSKLNVVNPDDVVEKYGADTLRLYEMFLGPLEQSKPWNTSGIDGTLRFLRRVWGLFYDRDGKLLVTDQAPASEELKALHKAIHKVEHDIEHLSFNTSVSAFMVCVNELTSLKCHKKAILEPFLVLLSPFAPHIAEELWETLGHKESITYAAFPKYNADFTKENDFEYPVMINGKLRHKVLYPTTADPKFIEEDVQKAEAVQRWFDGKTPKKVIVVPGKIVNIVV